jgi:hypothetical protein
MQNEDADFSISSQTTVLSEFVPVGSHTSSTSQSQNEYDFELEIVINEAMDAA